MIDDAERLHARQHAEVENDHDRDKRFEDQDEFALRNQVGFAGRVNQFRDLTHRAMDRQLLQVHVHGQTEAKAEHADDDAAEKQVVAGDAVEESHLREVWKLQIRFAALMRLGVAGQRRRPASQLRAPAVMATRLSAFLEMSAAEQTNSRLTMESDISTLGILSDSLEDGEILQRKRVLSTITLMFNREIAAERVSQRRIESIMMTTAANMMIAVRLVLMSP